MRLSVQRVLAAAPDAVWSALCSDEWESHVSKTNHQTRTVLSESRDGERLRRVTRIEGRELPALGRKVFGVDRIGYELTEVYEPSTKSIAWSVSPPTLREKMKAAGSYQIRPHASGCERVMTGDVVVSVPVVGGKVESIIVGELETAFGVTSDLLVAFVRARPT